MLLSVTCTVKGEAPAVVGVPESKPEELRFRPVGRVPLVRTHMRAPTPPFS